MGSTRLNSRVFTNSFASQNNNSYAAAHRLQQGNSFNNLSRPQYSHQTYYQLAYNGAGAGGRGGRWERAYGAPSTQFIPPSI